MKNLFKILFVLYTIIFMVSQNLTNIVEISTMLVLFVLTAINSKFKANNITIILMILSVSWLSYGELSYLFLYTLVSFDVMIIKKYWMLIFTYLPLMYFSYGDVLSDLDVFLAVGIATILGFVIEQHEYEKVNMLKGFDEERRRRYHIEDTSARLEYLNSEIRKSTQLKERNRIAREIHDNVGHKLSGIVLQMQAARKLSDIDQEKSKELLDISVLNIAQAIDMLRETVHNIKAQRTFGMLDIKKDIEAFDFCEIDMHVGGNFNNVDTFLMEILGRNTREGLTNVAKHSNATKVFVRFEANPNYIRLMIKDNGQKTEAKINEGLGFSGMRERVENVGGSFSYGFEDGFIQTTFIPIK